VSVLKRIVESAIRALRNPRFAFHPSITDAMIARLAWDAGMALVRGAWATTLSLRPRVVFLGRGVRILVGTRVRFGRGVRLGDYVHVSALGDEVVFGDNASIGAFSRVIVSTSYDRPGEHIRIGNNVGIGEFAYLGGGGGLEIGDDTISGQYLSVHPENHVDASLELPIRLQGVTRKGIKIGRNCWLGAKVTILDGVTLGDGCIVAAGAVVTQSFPPNAVVAGVPARVLRIRGTER
jgi:acetyltransferase-like isoleucine patch superfamily enzyme